jgi:hypothetical protein
MGSAWRSKGQRVELRCCGRDLAYSAIELALLDHVHQLNAGNEDACAAKGLESEHGPHDALDRAVVLFHDMIGVLALAQRDVSSRVLVDAQDGSRLGAALVDGDLLWQVVQSDGPLGQGMAMSMRFGTVSAKALPGVEPDLLL